MPQLNFANFARGTLSQDATSDAETIYISGDGLFPDGAFTAVIWHASEASPIDDADRELVTLARVSEGVFTAIRAEEGTTANAWQTGAYIANVLTAGEIEFLHTSADAHASIYTVTDNVYEMDTQDTNTILTHTTDESAKAITLPELSACIGQRYVITNMGSKLQQRAVLYPYLGDDFVHTSAPYISVSAFGRLVLTATNLGWVVSDIESNITGGLLTADSTYTTISFADGTVYADTTDGDLTLTFSLVKEYIGRPLTVVKTSDDVNTLTITDNTNSYEITSAYEPKTFIMDDAGDVHLLESAAATSGGGSGGDLIICTATTYLSGTERVVICNASSTIYIHLYHPELFVGKVVTVKKIDALTSTVRVYPFESLLDGVATYHVLSVDDRFASFTSDGTNWFRVG